MVEVSLNINKSIGENASIYYDESKKIKKKIEGAKAALAESRRKFEELEKEKEKSLKAENSIREEKERKADIKREWYEKFRWFISSEGFLCIGGRDATTNEIVIKKHTDKEDVVFHTEAAGSPFFIIKTEGKIPGKATLDECGQATASYSRAWKLGIASTDVFYVKPEQVSKEAETGEYIAKGAFMIRGKKNFMNADLKLAIGTKEEKIIGGPVNAIKKHAEKYILITSGKEKASDIAKKIKAKLGGEADDIIRSLPSGGFSISKQ
jgi:predicted ribosome quality control (RQC) complex YloA/Tae2 family protein